MRHGRQVPVSTEPRERQWLYCVAEICRPNDSGELWRYLNRTDSAERIATALNELAAYVLHNDPNQPGHPGPRRESEVLRCDFLVEVHCNKRRLDNAPIAAANGCLMPSTIAEVLHMLAADIHRPIRQRDALSQKEPRRLSAPARRLS